MNLGSGHLTLEFLPNPGGEGEGLGHAGIETFRHAPYASAAREAGQNSRDAFVTLPVRVTYDVLDLGRSEIPCIETLQAAVTRCLEQASADKDKAFFKQAMRAISQNRLRVLRVADFNTSGAIGPSQSGTPFHSLLKGSGVSVKEGIASGGSFGIGKNAAFAISDLQAVFYSTVYVGKDGSKHFLAQGKVILTSHRDAAGIAKRQTGYWGATNFEPVTDPHDVPLWMRRTEPGTSFFVVGFREIEDWTRTFALSLIQNFFPAIADGEMEFALDNGRLLLSKAGVGSAFLDTELQALAVERDLAAGLELSRQLYRCLTLPSVHEEVVVLPEIGRMRIRVMLEDGLPKKVFLVRNGMLITDSLEHFGDKFSRFPMYKDFVALVLPSEEAGSAFLKKLEDPKHRELSAERIPDPAIREVVRGVMKQLARSIRNTIKMHALTSFEKEQSIDEMRKYFATPTGRPQGKPSEADDPERLRYEVRERKKRPLGVLGHGEQSDVSGPGEDIGGTGPKGSTSILKGGSSSLLGPKGGEESSRTIRLHDLRNVLLGDAPGSGRCIYFTPQVDGDAEMSIFALGINSPEKLRVRKVVGAEFFEGQIRVSLVVGKRARIEVEFADPYSGPIDVVLTAATQPQPVAGERNEA